MSEIINKVEQSGIVTLNLEDFYPRGERVLIDIKNNLHEGIILKEKVFREHIKNGDWKQYAGKHVAITCTADAIVPVWAYMLLAVALEPFAKKIVFGDTKTLENILWHEALQKINPANFTDERVVIKGCSDKISLPESAYVELTAKLRPFVKSIMYGEICSTVPVYKKQAVRNG